MMQAVAPSQPKTEVTTSATAATHMTAAVIHPTAFRRRPFVRSPTARRSFEISTTRMISGPAMTPLRMALRTSAPIGSIPMKSIAIPAAEDAFEDFEAAEEIDGGMLHRPPHLRPAPEPQPAAVAEG